MCAASMRAGRGRRALRCDALRWRPLLALLSALLAASPVSTAEAAGFTVVWPGSDFKTVVEVCKARREAPRRPALRSALAAPRRAGATCAVCGLTGQVLCCPGRRRGALDTLPARRLQCARVRWGLGRAPARAALHALRLDRALPLTVRVGSFAGCNLTLAKNISMIAVVGTGERGSVPGNPPVLDCAGQERHFSVRAGVQVLLEGIHLRSLRALSHPGHNGLRTHRFSLTRPG